MFVCSIVAGYEFRTKLAFLNDPRDYKDLIGGAGSGGHNGGGNGRNSTTGRGGGGSPKVDDTEGGGASGAGLPPASACTSAAAAGLHGGAALGKRTANVCASWVEVRGKKHLLIWSIKPIAKGRELLLAYGPAYWSAHRQYCKGAGAQPHASRPAQKGGGGDDGGGGGGAGDSMVWDNVCFDCGQGGDLLCCESGGAGGRGGGCSAAFHLDCAGLSHEPPLEERWSCPLCEDPITELEAALSTDDLVATAMDCIVEAVIVSAQRAVPVAVAAAAAAAA
eukprot:SAG22_NODE_1321_length_4757_cov_1.980678_4_plen_277_part_01